MRVAVVTPYYQESATQLDRCHSSIVNQTHNDCRHFMVADGSPNDYCRRGSVEHIVLAHSHSDAGATPRAIGAMSAFSQGYDAVAFLDADNWYQSIHIEYMLRTLNQAQADAVVATRSIYDRSGELLYIDRVESNGVNMVDTNCMFLTRRAIPYLTAWITDPAHALISDRIFWHVCLTNGLKVIRCDNPTVGYVTKWAWHYEYVGRAVPGDTVWLERDSNGNYIHVTQDSREKKNESSNL